MNYMYEPDIKVDFAAEEIVSLSSHDQLVVDPMKSGFIWYTPPLASNVEHSTGGQTWQVSGHDMQVLTVTIPGQSDVVTEVGSFMFGSPDITMNVELTLCSKGGCGEGWRRICGGESCVKLILHNESSSDGYVGLTPSFPAKIIPIKFGTHIKENRALIAQPGTYMSELGDVDVSCDLDPSLATCCCAGFGLCRQRLRGQRDSVAFLAAGGTIVFRNLEQGETITVDTSSVLAIEEGVTLGIAPNGRCCMCLCGGEGCFSTTLTGPGKIFMQSLNFQQFQEAVQQTIVDDRGSSTSTDTS